MTSDDEALDLGETLTKIDVEKIVAATDDSHMETLIWLASETGLRMTKLSSLDSDEIENKWEDNNE